MSGSNTPLLSAVRGPLVMITVGVLFALQQSGGYPFWRTWPIVLIVIGLLKLLERADRTRSDTDRPPFLGGA